MVIRYMERIANKKRKGQLHFWENLLGSSFLPVIRQRGRRYANWGRVRLNEVSYEKILATVQGSRSYTVSISKKASEENKIVISCTCPFFKQGYPCKHIWAAIIEADRLLKEDGSGLPAKARDPKETQKAKKPDWRALFTEDLWEGNIIPPPWSDGPGQFVLCYELKVSPLHTKISAIERYLKKDGTFGRERRLQASTIEHRGLPKVDRAIIAVLDNVCRRDGRSYFYFYHMTYQDLRDLRLRPGDLELILPLLAETGRCRVIHSDRGLLADPLCKGLSEARLKLTVEGKGKKKEKSFEIVPILELGQDGKRISLGDVPVFFPTSPVLFIWDGSLFELPGPSLSWIEAILRSEGIEISKKEVREVLIHTESLPGNLEIQMPEGIGPETIEDLAPRPLLIVGLGEGSLKAQVIMDYGGLEVDWDDPRPSILDTEKWIRIIRQKEAESGILAGLSVNGFRQEGHIFQRDIRGAAEILSNLARDGWRIEGQDRKSLKGGRVSKLRVSSGIDWFDLEGGVSFGEEIVPLPRVIRAFLRGEKTVRLGDGTTGLLPEEWLSRNLPVLELGAAAQKKSHAKALRFSSVHALLLDSLLEENEFESVDSRFLEIKEALKNFSGIERAQVSPAFKGVLRSYQEDTMGWFAFLKKFGFGGILADDMGLGKTVQVLAWLAGELEDRKNGPSLVVAPTSILFNWQSEAMRFVPGIRILAYTGIDRSDLIRDMDQKDLVLTTYGLLRRDIKVLKDLNFNYVILDESQVIKNSDSQISKTVRLLRARHRLCLTGTPLENHVGELWSQMEFLNPGLLGPRVVFERKFIRPIAQGDEAALDLLKQMVRPFILRRTKESVAKEIQEKTEHVIFCPMTNRQARVYSQVRDHYRASVLASIEQRGINRSRIKVLEGLLRLRQAANHPALIGEDRAGSGKLQEILSLIEETISNGHKALVFSQFTKMLALIRNSIDNAGIAYEYLDGRTPRARREDKVRRFQKDRDIKLFLISLKAGGLGLNLTAADYVFIVDPWWNPAVELQAVDRTHRIGQNKKVFTYRFITEGTVEEKILALQGKKQEVVNAILSGGQDMLRKLSKEDVEILFS